MSTSQKEKDRPSNGQDASGNGLPKKSLFSTEIKSELAALLKLSTGTGLNSLFAYLIPFTTLLIVGHKGKVYLAALGLGFSVCNLTGNYLVIGMTSVTETLCSQAYGAKNFERFGIVIQRSVVITFVCILPSCALWINVEEILVFLGQDKKVSRLCSEFSVCYIPGLMCFILFNVLTRYLACQGITYPIILGSFLAFAVNGVFCYLFVYAWNFGIRGAAFALNLSYFSFSFYVLFVIFHNKLHYHTWHGWSRECLLGWKEYVFLAVPASSMIIFEHFLYELGLFLMGMIGRTEQATATLLTNISGLIYFLSFGISIGAAVRVGTFLGEGYPQRAKVTVNASLLISALPTLLYGLITSASKDLIGYLFTNDRAVVEMVSKVVILVAVHQVFDGFQTVLMGVARGMGYQRPAALINLGGYLFIATPLLLILVFEAHLGVFAVRIAVLVAVLFQNLGLIILLCKSDWTKLSKLAMMNNCESTEKELCANEGDALESKTAKLSSKESEIFGPAESEQLLPDEKSEKMLTNDSAKSRLEFNVLTKILVACFLFLLVVVSLMIRIQLFR